ncbi:hypothetical protein CUMW_000230 [Citrus unshiu]|nr:hypothetical protein CUMW_000230 [Citrus unshiu]
MMLLGWEIDKLQWDFLGAVRNGLIHLGGEIFRYRCLEIFLIYGRAKLLMHYITVSDIILLY